MESIIVCIIVGASAIWIGRSFYQQFQVAKTGGCNRGCGGCPGGAGECKDGQPGRIMDVRPNSRDKM
ncbi:MAG: FeoB-associated Cys-rich membrane protein [Desulfobacterales bacterium]|nr:FeoB-associated Cys-rich membrane protein [Desulfobacterales bacterium]